MQTNGSPNRSWIWKMAWRDSRLSRRRLLLYISAMILGVAALVAIDAFRQNLKEAVDSQSRALLGADLSLDSRRAFVPETEALIDSLGGSQTRQTRFSSMVYLPRTEDTRLAQIRALTGPYPFYGTFNTDPPSAEATYLNGPYALVEESLMLQFNIQYGDSIQVGRNRYAILGTLKQIPGEAASAGLFSGPRVFIPDAYLDRSLLNTGSRVNYTTFFKFDDGYDTEPLWDALEAHREKYQVGMSTVRSRSEGIGQALDNLYRFLSLVGFIALLLGGIGVASAVHVYIRQKTDTVATLRCIGASTRQAFTIYLIQAGTMGIMGAVIGAILGLAVQLLLPGVVQDFLPVQVDITPHWPAVVQGIGIGLLVALVFALLPLLSIRKVSPLRALRASYEATENQGRDPLRWALYGLMAVLVVGFAVYQTGHMGVGLGFAGGLAVVFGLLFAVAKGITFAIRKFFPSGWPYVWRQGLANLYRPNNQTVILMLALGLGTFLVMTLYLIQNTLLQQVASIDLKGQANTIVFDIQEDQQAGVTRTVQDLGLPIFEQTPIVTMRLAKVGDRTTESLREDTSYTHERWPLFREYRSTFRDTLTSSETIVSGTWHGATPYDPRGNAPALISIEEDIAQDLGVTVGDELTFDVQGLPIRTRISSIRLLDWQQMRSNFFVVFQPGVLEPAPKFYVMSTRSAGAEETAALQRALVQSYPNVSVIDVDLILRTANDVLSKISFVIQFMALFSIFTGLIVLISAVVISRFQRIRESVLLRTLGASSKQVVRIMLVEYFLLGTLATLTGLLLAVFGTWALVRFVFEIPLTFSPPALPILMAFALVTGLTMLIGFFNSRGTYNRPPLEVLRTEA